MSATILCPGPSLAEVASLPRGGLIIAVNRAALKFPESRVWACSDEECLQNTLAQAPDDSPLRSAHILTTAATAQTLSNRSRRLTITFEEMFSFLHPTRSGTGWSTLTIAAAIVLGAYLGHREISVLGCDWEGTRDFDGIEGDGDRTPRRWENEKIIVRRTAEALGVSLHISDLKIEV
jgi:hypothetical protein